MLFAVVRLSCCMCAATNVLYELISNAAFSQSSRKSPVHRSHSHQRWAAAIAMAAEASLVEAVGASSASGAVGQTTAERLWTQEVWSYVGPHRLKLMKNNAGGLTSEQWKDSVKTVNVTLKGNKEARGVKFNLAHLNPHTASIPSDIVCLTKAERSGRYHFWDQVKNAPRAPTAWPRGQNLPISVLQPDLCAASVRHYGLDSVLCGFWWAFAQSVKSGNKVCEAGFNKLCLECLVDVRIFATEDDIVQASFQLVEDSEEQREHNGFTGFRKMLVVSWAHGLLKKRQPKDKQVGNDEIAAYLRTTLRWHDEHQAPSANVVRDLMQIAKHCLKNSRVMQAIQEVEMIWGRKTLFDDYTKLTAMVNRSRGPDDLAFTAEYLAAKMKRTTPKGSLPDSPSRSALLSKAGDIGVSQLMRDTLVFIKKSGTPAWVGFTDHSLLQTLMTPTGFESLFPQANGGQTPEEAQGHTAITEKTTSKLAAAPNSLRLAVSLIGGVLRRPEFARVANGVLTHPPASGVDFEKMLESAFQEDWQTFQEAFQNESGLSKPAEKPDKAGEKEKDKGKDNGEMEQNDEEQENTKHKSLETAARERARNVVAHDPGLVIMSPDTWCQQALATALNGQISHGGMSNFVAFFDPKCDEDCRVHPGQNVFLHFPAVNKDRLEAFMQAVGSVMRDARDAGCWKRGLSHRVGRAQ